MRITLTLRGGTSCWTLETVSLGPADSQGTLSALAGRIVCIGMRFDDGESITEESFTDQDERDLLIRFWETIRETDFLIGHNILNFDLPFIRQRSWLLSTRPSRRTDLRRFYSKDVFDTMRIPKTRYCLNHGGVLIQHPFPPQSAATLISDSPPIDGVSRLLITGFRRNEPTRSCN